jgi:uncharacterized protein YlbG (UPF0298 family)
LLNTVGAVTSRRISRFGNVTHVVENKKYIKF